MTGPLAAILVTAGGALVLGGAVHAGLLALAARRRRRFLEGLGEVVRIATPCRLVDGSALLPATLGLTPAGLSWEALDGRRGAAAFARVRRLETDRHLLSGRPLLLREALRVTLVGGETLEFVLTRGHAWEWRRALGEWTGAGGAPRAFPESPGAASG